MVIVDTDTTDEPARSGSRQTAVLVIAAAILFGLATDGVNELPKLQ
jgi:hypothetical protein